MGIPTQNGRRMAVVWHYLAEELIDHITIMIIGVLSVSTLQY